MVRIWWNRSLGRLNLLDILLFATTRWSLVTLDPGKKIDEQPFYYSLTRRSRVQVLPTRAMNDDIWDRHRIVNNMR
jgi:hypothetical protein